MDRRTLLAMAALLPVLATGRANACSVALATPRSTGLENDQVRRLFEAWWERDEAVFRAHFTERYMADGSPMDPQIAAELQQMDSPPPDAFSIFGRFFTDTAKVQTLGLLVNTAAGVIVGCSEASAQAEIEADCSGMPVFHLFHVTMHGLKAHAVTHIASEGSAEPAKFGIWTEG
jgi:hypothetical protein